MGQFFWKERALWGMRCHEEQLSSLRHLGWELQSGKNQLDLRKNL